MPEFKDRINEALEIRGIKSADLARISGVNEGAISQYRKGKYEASQRTLDKLAVALDVSVAWLMGNDVPMDRSDAAFRSDKFPSPDITEEYVTFPVVGDIAAGYDNIAVESWDGEKIKIPADYLNGHKCEEFFVLRVKGQSMYPLYHEGDKVLILKQSTLNRSGEIGAILYDDEIATLKKVEYVPGEDWLELIPLNHNYAPERIEGERLEHCRVIGIPRLLIREIK